MNYVGVEPHTVVAAVSVLAAPCAAVRPLLRGDGDGALRAVARLLLVGSVLFVLAITLLGVTASSGSQVNWRPGASFGSVEQTLEFVGNVVLFAPSGFLAVVALRRRVREVTAAGMLLSLLVEVAQWETGRRWADVDDLIANTLGAFLGAVAAVAVLELLRRRVAQSR